MIARALVLAGLCLMVAACNRNPLEVKISRCSAVAVVGDAGTVTRFAGSGRTDQDVSYTATIMNVLTDCEEPDDKESGEVTATTRFVVGATAGPALTSRTVDISYFVAVLKDNSRIITKKTYPVTLNFDADGKASSAQTIRHVVPSIEQARRYDYEVIVGFQLSPDEAVYNMERS
ncbi:hypothetical protein [Gimibacter soli]|uniref:Type VI secretion system lipoprotein TssJ n=1 Tax=Gimibacter soli TaxID=3024400 RepID=A0AAF0BJX4_9PROT|nr:hypothetical protein [Gimibacter soli]WCL53624.1 hypothetical protein PH603_13880 [Gimibacter soli]